MSELVSQAEAARQLGVTRQAVHHLVKAKKLPLIDGKIHVASARAVLAQKLDPAFSKILRGAVAPTAPDVGGDSGGPPGGGFVDYADARAKKEHHEASLAEMRAMRMAGDLVARDAVETAAFRVGRMMRDAVLGVPAKIATELTAAADHWEAQQIMVTALRKALDDVSRLSAGDMDRDLAS